MLDNLKSKEEILKEFDMSSDILDRLIKKKIIIPVLKIDENIHLFDITSIKILEKISNLLSLGYTIEQVEKIIRKIGVPGKIEKNFDYKNKKYLTIGQIAEFSNINVRTIKHWEEKGIISPDTRSEGGYRLYQEYYIEICKYIRDLQLFGYTLDEIKEISDLYKSYISLKVNKTEYKDKEKIISTIFSKIEELEKKMELISKGIGRWKNLLKKYKKELKKENQDVKK